LSGSAPGAHFETILVPIDFSKASHSALALARDLARDAGPAKLVLVHACFVPVEIEALVGSAAWSAVDDVNARAEGDLGDLVRELGRDGVEAEAIARRGSPDRVVLELAAERSADLIVMGTHGRTGLAHAFLGSVAERVAREADCPVLTTKP
jgi:nucleotide-binding universal stress UspA family protein